MGDDLQMLWGLILGAITTLFQYVSEWKDITVQSGLSPSWSAIIKYIMSIFVVLGSGFFAATLAELKHRNRPLHFMMGLAIPGLYPLVVFFLLPTLKDKTTDNDETLEEENAQPTVGKIKIGKSWETTKADTINTNTGLYESKVGVAKAGIAHASDTVIPTETDIKSSKVQASVQDETKYESAKYNQKHFSSIAVNADGHSQGPFMIETVDGQLLETLRIVNTMPELMILDMGSGDEDERKTIRMPYSKVKSCMLKSEWMNH